ncbi:TPA: hypothetical protein F7136_04640 [Legionella pneumophila]|uniref:Uncharacterized protein n=1 Tax=Legionella waltersii TaxID=66969 RepID=A0A0W1A0J6_9GAMM|nr:hypothetical protein [Legionella waltersii]HAU3626727.1 hypothetical protein [Legionella pneumophila]KTD74842.1 hypothetical protein Lwal_2883 [Legionella waltersii]SNV11794.1 Uncharacterised protein [Legionella waltersii]HAU3646456.1 hypothetical protein [Legionella pneumophila]HAU3652815.1 hypothetical protein [Legionella pneumophila]
MKAGQDIASWNKDNMMTEILVALISSGFLIFLYNECKKHTYKNFKHDRKIYSKINSIINDEHILSVIKGTQIGYLPKDTYWKVDSLVEFIQLPKNKFLNKKLNVLLSDLTVDLHKIAEHYSMCGRCELIGDQYKLVAYKNGDPEEFELLHKSKEYSSELFKSYKIFRNKIKRKFKL